MGVRGGMGLKMGRRRERRPTVAERHFLMKNDERVLTSICLTKHI